MDILTLLISRVNDVLWTYILIIMLLGCAFWFTFKTNFVQFRMIREMIRLLGDSTGKTEGREHHISSFQAFAVSIASRVGTGNLAGVATAITLGGPGAVFWMWVKKGLKQPWMGVLFAFLLIFTFGFAFNSVQSNTICAAFEEAFNIPPSLMGVILTSLTLVIIFGGIQRIAKVSSIIVPVMALGYIFLSLFIVIVNAKHLPEVIELIIANAFGWEQALSGGIGIALMQGIKRGLFSNEAGMGSAPNVVASADVTHPVKQGLIQTLGVFTDTLVICTCTAFIILFSGVASTKEANGIKLTQMALNNEIGNIGTIYVAVAILFFAYSSILGNYYYGEANVRYITHRKWAIPIYRIAVGGMVMFGALASLELAWSLADMAMGFMTICNLIAITLLGKYAFRLLEDYRIQKRNGVKNPVFTKDRMKDIENDLECW